MLEVFQQVKKIYRPGTQLVKVRNYWHVHKYKSVWDKEKKKAVKKFVAHLGVIKDGKFIPARRRHKKRRKAEPAQPVQKETKPVVEVRHAGWENERSYVWGADRVVRHVLEPLWGQIEGLLEEDVFNSVRALGMVWGVWGVEPLKRVTRQWERLWSSRELPAQTNATHLSRVLEHIGRRPGLRTRLATWFLSMHTGKPLLFDMTHVFMYSRGIDSACYGWNAEKKYLPQVRMMLLSARERITMMEVAGGNLHEVHMLAELQERLKDQIDAPLIFVTDRACASHSTYRQQYLEERITREELHRKEQRAGKIALVTNTDMEPSEVYEVYKMRQHVEEVVDRFRNHLLAERTYARTDEQIQGWIWVALHVLQVHWFLLDRLKGAGLLKKWSVEDVLKELREIRREPTPTGWRFTPISNSVKRVLANWNWMESYWLQDRKFSPNPNI